MFYFSYEYIPFFLGFTLLAYYAVPLKKRWIVLLAASLAFYFYYTKLLVIYILITSVAVYFAALWLEKIDSSSSAAMQHLPPGEKADYKTAVAWQKKAVVVSLLLVDFGILAMLEYSGYVAGEVNGLLRLLPIQTRLPVLKMALPLGISFYTLQAAGYVIDVYRKKVKANPNFGQILLFLSFFPQIVEGPIGRYGHLGPQLYEGHRFHYEDFTGGMQLILWGLLKEIVIADRASMLVDQVFGHYPQYSGMAVVLAILLYTLQLYADFSGCIDVAIGSAQMFGIHLDPNFLRPFFSESVNEFWRRWHMTLGAWLRSYIFYPVALSKPVGKLNRYVRRWKSMHLKKCAAAGSALFFVWLGMGIWHGAGLKYIAYGMYYFLLMMLGMLFEPFAFRITSALHINRDSGPYHIFQILRTFVLVNIGLLIFRAGTLESAFSMFLSVFRGPGFSAVTNGSLLHLGLDLYDLAVLGTGVLVLFTVGLLQEKGISIRSTVGRWPLPARWAVYLSAVFVLIVFGAYGVGYNPADLIYAKF